MGLAGAYDSALDGSLEQFALPDIFGLLSFTKKSGALHLQGSVSEGVVYFQGGSVTGATSNVRRQALGRRLVGQGLLTDESIVEALDQLSTTPGRGLGKVLRDGGAVEEAVLHDVVAEQATDAIFDLLRWSEGDFTFRTDEPNPDDLGVTLGITDIVADAEKRLERWETLTVAVPGPDSVPLVSVKSGASEVAISAEEWSLMALIDGERDVAALVDCTGRGDFHTVGILAGLINRNLVTLKKGGSADGHDSVIALLRRQELLRRVEGETPLESRGASALPGGLKTVAAFATTTRPAPQARVQPALPIPAMPKGAPTMQATAANSAQSQSTRGGIDPAVTQSVLLRLINGLQKA